MGGTSELQADVVTHSNEEEAGCFTAAWTCGSDLVLHPFRSEEYLTAGVGHHGKIQNRVWFGGTSPKMADMYTSHKHKFAPNLTHVRPFRRLSEFNDLSIYGYRHIRTPDLGKRKRQLTAHRNIRDLMKQKLCGDVAVPCRRPLFSFKPMSV
ncbi:unnamed protein product [Arctogadus glacialis]